MNVFIKFKKTHEDAVLPKATNTEVATGDSGYDLFAVENVCIPSGGSKTVPVGLTVADITPGYWFRIEPRSGLGFKHSIQPHLGVIDNGYRGDLAVKLYNFSDEHDYQVNKGDKIAQLVFYPVIQPTMSFSEEITETSRGENGFGSSDKTNDTQDLKNKSYNIKQIDDFWEYADAFDWQTRDKVASGEYIPNPMKVDESDPDFIPNPDK